MKGFQQQTVRWLRQVDALAASGFYADEARAAQFVARHVYPAWRAINEAESLEEIVGKRGITSTQVLVVHLFARGVLGVGAGESGAPRRMDWRPSGLRGIGGAPISPRVISVADIGKIVHRSPSAVQRALRRLKGLDGPRPRHGTWNVLSMPTGVALDGMLSTATRHPYMYAGHEYADARSYAHGCRSRHARFTKRQDAWCTKAMLASGMEVKRAKRGAQRKSVSAA